MLRQKGIMVPLRAIFSVTTFVQESIANFKKSGKPGAKVGSRCIMGSFGAHAHLFLNSWAPNDPMTERALTLAPVLLFLKVRY